MQGNPFSLTPGDQINFSYDTFSGADCSSASGFPFLRGGDILRGQRLLLQRPIFLGPGRHARSLQSHFFAFYQSPAGGLLHLGFRGRERLFRTIAGVHTFGADGEYTVCLTLKDQDGCSNSYFQTLVIGNPPGYCDFEVNVSVEWMELTAEVFNLTDYGPYPQNVEWYNGNTNGLLGTAPVLSLSLPDSNFLTLLCAYYQVEYPNGTVCEGEWCESGRPPVADRFLPDPAEYPVPQRFFAGLRLQRGHLRQ